MTRRDIIQLGLTLGGGLLLPRWLSAQSSIHVGGPLAGGVYYTRASPGLWASLVGEHVPKLEKSEGPVGSLTIRVSTARSPSTSRPPDTKARSLRSVCATGATCGWRT